jgi:hypothetical protein
MYRVALIPAEQEEDETEHNKDNTYNKAADQNAGKDFQIAYETRRFIHFSPPGWLLGSTSSIGCAQQFILCVI